MSATRLPQPLRFRRALEPLANGLWIAFGFATLIVIAVWVSGVDDADLQRDASNRALPGALAHASAILDVSWVTLAAVNVYLSTAAAEGLATTRRWAAIALLSSGLIAFASTTTGWPLGSVQYTDRLGTRIGPVPFGFPLLWFAMTAGARSLVLRLWPAMSHWQVALTAGSLILLSDLNLEPIAWKARGFWIWHPADVPGSTWPPLQNYFTWFVLGTALVYAMRSSRVAPHPAALSWRPAITFVVLNGVLLAAHVARGWRTG